MVLTDREKRRFVRAAVDCKIHIQPPMARTIPAVTENIGAGGIKVIVKERFFPHSIVGVEIFIEKEKILCKAKIIYSLKSLEAENIKPEDPALFDTAMSFSEIEEKDKQLINNFVNKVILRL